MAASTMTQGILAFNKDLVSFARQTVFAEWETPDVIQCYNWLTFPAAYELGQSLHIPVVSTIQFVSEPCERWWGQIPDPEIVEQEAMAFRHADRLITVSHSMRSIVQRTHGVPDHKIHVVYNAMDVEAFTKNNIAPQHLTKLRGAVASGGEKIVFFAGRLNPQKGVSAIFESIPQVLEHYPNVKYIFAGEPDSQHFARTLREMFDQNPVLKSKTVMLGKLPRHKLAALYKIADVALVPSVYEPFGYAAIEAMAAGVPLVATAAGGLAEIVDHEKTGLSVPVHVGENGVRSVDVPGLALATRRMLQDEDLTRQMALAAGEKVKKVFELETMVRDTRAIYEAAISEFQPQYA
jgi:glycosyltransferase involved in cell wall biosynthesis